MYHVCKRLLDAETRYPEMEKLALALMVSTRKLKYYFQAHPIDVRTNYPLRQVLQKPEASDRILEWSVELGQFDIEFKPWAATKGQALANFVAKFTTAEEQIAEAVEKYIIWKLYIDGSSNENGDGAGVILVSPENYKITSAL